MTDRDNIELPPLPPFVIAPIADEQTVRDYARAAILADRERRAKPDAKPVVHEARMSLADNGDWNGGANPRPGRINILIHWTADGRVWIESEKNREMAQKLRSDSPLQRHFYHLIADALDGGM